jgi:hypothetical protein
VAVSAQAVLPIQTEAIWLGTNVPCLGTDVPCHKSSRWAPTGLGCPPAATRRKASYGLKKGPRVKAWHTSGTNDPASELAAPKASHRPGPVHTALRTTLVFLVEADPGFADLCGISCSSTT